MPVGGGPATRLTDDLEEDRYPIWHPDGKRILYTSTRAGIYQVCQAYMDGRPPQQITFGESDSFVVAISPDGTKLVYTSSKEESDIWRVKTDTGEEDEMTASPGCELEPDVAPDGKTLAFQFVRDPGQGARLLSGAVLTTATAGEVARRQLAEEGFDVRWSPDGQRLAFLRRTGNEFNLWAIRPEGEEEKRLTPDNILIGGYDVMPYNLYVSCAYSWSPDSRRLLYCSATADVATVALASADGTDQTILLKDNDAELFHDALWSPDVQRIACLSLSRTRSAEGKRLFKVWLIGAPTGKAEVLYQSDAELHLLGWSASGDELILAKLDSSKAELSPMDFSLMRVVVSSGAAHAMARLQSAYFHNIHLSPDRHRIAFAARPDGKDNLWLIPAAGGQAKKATANTDPRLYFSSLAWSPDSKALYYGKQSMAILITMVDNFK